MSGPATSLRDARLALNKDMTKKAIICRSYPTAVLPAFNFQGTKARNIANESLRWSVSAMKSQRCLLTAGLAVGRFLFKNLDAYNENDGGHADMFADRYSGVVRYIHARESWFIWDGNRWLSDAVENVHQLALELSKTLAADLLKAPGRPDGQKIRRAIAMGSKNKISATLWLARSDPRIVIKREEIDGDNFLLGARNGVIDLRTGQRRDGRKGDFITKSCGCNHDATATAPRWRAFLKEIFNEQDDLIQYIQRLVGYSLTGDTREQCLVFLYGSGANGKSTFVETLMELFGDYGTTASQNILASTGMPENRLMKSRVSRAPVSCR